MEENSIDYIVDYVELQNNKLQIFAQYYKILPTKFYLQNFTYNLKHPVLLSIKCTPLQSSYMSSIRYVERFYVNFLLKTPNFIDLIHFFLNRVFHNKN